MEWKQKTEIFLVCGQETNYKCPSFLFSKNLHIKQKILKINLNSIVATKLYQTMEIRTFLLQDGIGMWVNVDSDHRGPGFKDGIHE